MVTFRRLTVLGAVFFTLESALANCSIYSRKFKRAASPTGSLSLSREFTDIKELSGEEDLSACVEKINNWRKNISAELPPYSALQSHDVQDIDAFLQSLSSEKCETVGEGTFPRIHAAHAESRENNTPNIFVVSATKPGPASPVMSCTEMIEEWEKGFNFFKNKIPPAYDDPELPAGGLGADRYDNHAYVWGLEDAEEGNVYDKAEAAGFISLLSNSTQHIYCGTLDNCEEQNTIICYFKPTDIKEHQPPVTKEIWRWVEEYKKVKPKLEPQQDDALVDAVNEIRKNKTLGLPLFSSEKGDRVPTPKGTMTVIEKALDAITCEQVNNGTIDPAAAKDHTLMFFVKDASSRAITTTEVIDHWKSGFDAFEDKTLPQYDSSSKTLYEKSEVSGYVAMMTGKAPKMSCYNATGCTKSAVICVITEAIFKNENTPLDEETWKKVLVFEGVNPGISDATKTCVEAINAVRTKETLNLPAYTEERENHRSAAFELNDLKCEDIKDSKLNFIVDDGASSLMFYFGADSTSATCADAVTEWQKGYSKFENIIPPAYKPEAKPYTDAAATNFVSLLTDKTTAAKCITTIGCDKAAVICKLTPAVVEEDKVPLNEDAWAKIVATMESSESSNAFYAIPVFFNIIFLLAAALQ